MKRTCLLVDDNGPIRGFLKDLLQPENFDALEAENAPQAFKLIQKLQGNFDLIVTDIRMPGEMSGLDLAFAVRTAFPAIPVIVISGYEYRDLAKQVLGQFELIEKPFKPGDFLAVVKKLSLR